MKLLDRVRSMFTSTPAVGEPSTGKLMERGEGDIGSHHDEERDTARRRDLGAPNDTIEDVVRPPTD
jgi:hypothetical protein